MHSFFRKAYTILPLLSLPPMAGAASAATAPETPGFDFNPTLAGLVSLVLILLMVIGFAANVLRQLSFVYRDKIRAEGKARTDKNQTIAGVLLLIICCIPSLRTYAQEVADGTGTMAQAIPESPYIHGILKTHFYTIISILVLETVVLMSLLVNIRMLIRLMRDQPEKAVAARKIVRLSFLDRFNRSVAVEKEADIILDHDYDGIKELDNSLPPWWKYGFYLTIVVSVIYLYHYHGGGNGPGSAQEYEAAVAKGEQEVAAYLAKSANNVDEHTIKVNAADVPAGEAIFKTNCVACHAADGGGGIGPNLTDEYWLHGGSIQDIFKSIKYGWQDKGMKSWKDDLSPRQLGEVANYVHALKGAKAAAPKPPQGEVYNEDAGNHASVTAPAKDSIKNQPIR